MDNVSDEYIKKLMKVKHPPKQTSVLLKDVSTKGRKTPPGLRIASYPTFADLENWRQMHQHTAFNQNRIITEKDVLESLQYVQPMSRTASVPSTYRILKNHRIYKSKHQNELIKENRINKNLSHMSKISKYPHKDYWPKDPYSSFKPSKFVPFSKLPEKELSYEAAWPPTPSLLLRRPLAPVWRNKDSLARESSLSIILADDDRYDLDQWRKCSLTTLFKDDPLDPKSFYNTHYPLLLKQVPKRFKNDEGSDNYDTMYRPMSRTPDIDMRYFDVMSRVSLSDEIVLPDDGRCGSSSSRKSYTPRSLKSTPETKTPDVMNTDNKEAWADKRNIADSSEEVAEFMEERTSSKESFLE